MAPYTPAANGGTATIRENTVLLTRLPNSIEEFRMHYKAMRGVLKTPNIVCACKCWNYFNMVNYDNVHLKVMFKQEGNCNFQ